MAAAGTVQESAARPRRASQPRLLE